MAKGSSCIGTCVAKLKGFSALRKRGDWEENDEEQVLGKIQNKGMSRIRLPKVPHKSYLDRYVCVCVCVRVRVYNWECLFLYLRFCASITLTTTVVGMYVFMCVRVWTHDVCMYVCIYVYMYIYIYIYIYIYM